MTSEQREIQRKLRILEYAEKIGDVSKTCRYFGIGRASFYRWRKAYSDEGYTGLAAARSVQHNHPNKMSPEVEEKILHLRRTYHLGPIRIVWYLERYHAIKVSDAGVYRTLKRHGLNRLPRGTRVRKIHTQRYNKQVPGHHIQMDVKFLIFKGKQGQKVKRYQYTAIDDAMRVRALKVYKRHTQANAIDFVDHIIEKFPFRIQQIRTDNVLISGQVPLACRGQGNPTRLHQAEQSPAQWQSRTLAPVRRTGILSASVVQRRCRSGAKAGRMGAVLQLCQTA